MHKRLFMVAGFLLVAVGVFWLWQSMLPDELGEIWVSDGRNQQPTAQTTSAERATPSDWNTFTNARYRYNVSYPQGAIVSSLRYQQSEETSDTIALQLQQGIPPMRICAVDNSANISSQELFESWTNISGTESPPSNCSTSRNRLLSSSPTQVASMAGYKATIRGSDMNEVCFFLAGQDVLLAVCIPEDNPSDQRWKETFTKYSEIASTLKMVE